MHCGLIFLIERERERESKRTTDQCPLSTLYYYRSVKILISLITNSFKTRTLLLRVVIKKPTYVIIIKHNYFKHSQLGYTESLFTTHGCKICKALCSKYHIVGCLISTERRFFRKQILAFLSLYIFID